MSRFYFHSGFTRHRRTLLCALALIGVSGLTVASPRAEGRDCSQNDHPSFGSHFFNPVLRLALSGRYAYVVDGSGWGLGADLQVFDVVEGVRRATIPTSAPFCIDVDHERVYLGGMQLQIVDVSDPTAPQILGTLPTPQYVTDVAVVKSHAYLAGGDGLQVLDVSDPTSPIPVANVAISGSPSSVAVNGSYAYVAGDFGLAVVDVSDPSSPSVVGTCVLPGHASDIAIRGSHAYVGNHVGLQVLDLSRPKAPRMVGSVDTPGDAQQVAVSGARAYVAEGGSTEPGLRIIDISNPTNPVIVNSIVGVTTLDETGYWERTEIATMVSASEERVAVAGYVLNHGLGDCEFGCFWLSGYLDVKSASAYEPPPPCSGPAVESAAEVPAHAGSATMTSTFALLGNDPNPFNPETLIRFDVPRSSRVRIQICDARGRLVQTLVDGTLSSGRHGVSWTGRNTSGEAAASGIYFVTMEAAGFRQIRKITLLK